MSAERKKLLWISISACVFVLIVLAAGFFLMAPKKGASQAPATISNVAPPKAQDPQDFLSAPPPAPALEQPHNQDGGVIIVYGDKPKLPEAAPGSAASPASAGASQGAAAPGAAAPGGAGDQVAAAKVLAPAKPSSAKTPGAGPAAKGPAVKAGASLKPGKAARVDEFWIQAASFTSRGRADELKQGLAEKGIAALISVKDISGKSYYRVRVGPYPAKPEADGWLGRLKDIPGCGEAYVTKMSSIKNKP